MYINIYCSFQFPGFMQCITEWQDNFSKLVKGRDHHSFFNSYLIAILVISDSAFLSDQIATPKPWPLADSIVLYMYASYTELFNSAI